MITIDQRADILKTVGIALEIQHEKLRRLFCDGTLSLLEASRLLEETGSIYVITAGALRSQGIINDLGRHANQMKDVGANEKPAEGIRQVLDRIQTISFPS